MRKKEQSIPVFSLSSPCQLFRVIPNEQRKSLGIDFFKLPKPFSRGFAFINSDSISFETDLEQLVYISIALRFGAMSDDEFKREIYNPVSVNIYDLISNFDLSQLQDIKSLVNDLSLILSNIIGKSVILYPYEMLKKRNDRFIVYNLFGSITFDGSFVVVRPTFELKELYEQTMDIFKITKVIRG